MQSISKAASKFTPEGNKIHEVLRGGYKPSQTRQLTALKNPTGPSYLQRVADIPKKRNYNQFHITRFPIPESSANHTL